MDTAGKKVRAWRLGKKFTLKEAGDYLGISVSYLSELENNVKPFTRSIIEILLDKDPSYFSASDFFNSAIPSRLQAITSKHA